MSQIIRNRSSRCILVCLIILFWVTPATFAGGWAMVTLDSLPTAPQAGEKLQLGFMVRQHGLHPVDFAARPALIATHEETGQTIQADAQPDGPVGHFVVEVVFPEPGVWQWRIKLESLGTFPELFEALTILPAPEPVAEPSASASTNGAISRGWPVIIGLIVVGGLALMIQRGQLKPKTAIAIASASLLVLLFATFAWPLTTTGAASSPQVASNLGQVEPPPDASYGRALFVAKGCPACHIHASITNSVPGPLIGPALTNYEAAPEFLHQWLQNPQAIRPNTQMPNLNLSDYEIDALIAFLASDAN